MRSRTWAIDNRENDDARGHFKFGRELFRHAVERRTSWSVCGDQLTACLAPSTTRTPSSRTTVSWLGGGSGTPVAVAAIAVAGREGERAIRRRARVSTPPPPSSGLFLFAVAAVTTVACISPKGRKNFSELVRASVCVYARERARERAEKIGRGGGSDGKTRERNSRVHVCSVKKKK